MIVKNSSIKLETRGNFDIKDITSNVQNAVAGSDVDTGVVNIFVPGATGALTTIECEKGLLEDFRNFFEDIIPADGEYKHNLSHAGRNGHSHVRASLLGPSLTVPVREGVAVLGTWQRIVFIDMDSQPRSRSIMLTIMGHGKTS